MCLTWSIELKKLSTVQNSSLAAHFYNLKIPSNHYERHHEHCKFFAHTMLSKVQHSILLSMDLIAFISPWHISTCLTENFLFFTDLYLSALHLPTDFSFGILVFMTGTETYLNYFWDTSPFECHKHYLVSLNIWYYFFSTSDFKKMLWLLLLNTGFAHEIFISLDSVLIPFATSWVLLDL